MIVASFYGVVFIYFIYLSGKVHLWIKGIGFGMIVWVSILGFILMQLIGDKLPQDPQGVLVTTAAHFFFGVSLAAFTRLLGKDMSFFGDELNNLIDKYNDKKVYRLLTPSSLKKKSNKKKTRAFKKPIKI